MSPGVWLEQCLIPKGQMSIIVIFELTKNYSGIFSHGPSQTPQIVPSGKPEEGKAVD